MRVRKTSSRVGRRSGDVVDRRSAAASRLRTADGDRARADRAPAPGRRRRRPRARRRRARASAAIASCGLLGPLEPDLDALAADALLELVGGALGDQGAVVDHRDPVGEAVGLVEVLGGQQHGRALGDPRLDHLPEARSGCAGRARSSARRGTAPAGGRRAPRRGRGGGACRPSRCFTSRSPASARSKRSSSSLARSRDGLAAQVVEAPDHLQVLEPGQALVDGGVLAREADLLAQLGGVVDDVEPVDARAARRGRQQRGQDAHGGGLAGAVGAEQAEHGPGLDLEVDPAERLDVLVGLLAAPRSRLRSRVPVPTQARPSLATRDRARYAAYMAAVESINYHLELTPAQLKITHTALRSLLDDFGHDEREIHTIIQEVLAKLPDEHAIRAIQLDAELEPTTSRARRRTPTRRPAPRPSPSRALSLSVQIGLLLALATAFASVLGFLYKHRGAVESPRGRAAAPDPHLARPLSLALVHARDRRRDGGLGPARRRAGAGADLARPVGDRRRAGAAHGDRRPAVRPPGHPARVDRRRARGARARLPRRDARGRRRRGARRLRDRSPGHLRR